MHELIDIIKETVKPYFLNIRTALKTYNRNALCCNTPCWRWAYHALHSADKWFINPFKYEEPSLHEDRTYFKTIQTSFLSHRHAKWTDCFSKRAICRIGF